jgi:hypothetical protein
MYYVADFETTTVEPAKIWAVGMCEIENIDNFRLLSNSINSTNTLFYNHWIHAQQRQVSSFPKKASYIHPTKVPPGYSSELLSARFLSVQPEAAKKQYYCGAPSQKQ